jgi:hypothetical protein
VRARAAALALLAVAAHGCDAPGAGKVLGRDDLPTPPAIVPVGGGTAIGESCVDQDLRNLCVAVKYVAYVGPSGRPTLTQAQALENLRESTEIFGQCGIAFQLEEFVAARPEDHGLRFNTADLEELDGVRGAFADASRLLVVATGEWDRSGTLGDTEANAWTSVPGLGPFGAVMESWVGTYAPLVAHELGHYLNLEHEDDEENLMSALIYDSSRALTARQCSELRDSARYFWGRMLR